MYEDWSAGRITEYIFRMLAEKQQREQPPGFCLGKWDKACDLSDFVVEGSGEEML